MGRHRLGIIVEQGQIQVYWQRDLAVRPSFAPSIPNTVTFSKHQNEMAWYTRDYQGETAKDVKRAAIFEIKLKRWGQKVFKLLFANPNNLRATLVFNEALRVGLENTELVISSTYGGSHNTPWELLYSPRYDYLAPQLGAVYRVVPQNIIGRPILHPLGRCLNILLVISRPDAEKDLSPAVFLEPLLRKLDPWLRRGQVKLKVLRPPSFLEFNRELGENKGYWHVVHFEGHGTLGSLVFEKPKGGPHYVSARQVANSLRNCRVPLVILEACDSGKFFNSAFKSSLSIPSELNQPSPSTSIASELITLGTKAVLTMAYPVLAQASSDFMIAFYAGLLMGKSVSECVAAGRRLLFLDRERPLSTGSFEVSDWMIPVLYQSEAYTPFPKSMKGKSSFRAALEVQSDSRATRNLLLGLPRLGPIDFVGRITELSVVERAFQYSPVLVLTGRKGQGKTALACEMARTLVRTSGRQRVFYRSFKGTKDLKKVILVVGKVFMGKQFLKVDFPKQRRGVINYLLEHPCLLIWDRFNRVDKRETTEAKGEISEITSFLNKFRDGKTWILIIMRQWEKWIPTRCLRVSLGGMYKHDAEEYAENILHQHDIDIADITIRADADEETVWQEVVSLCVGLLDSNPLLMKKMLPKLAYKTLNALKRDIRKSLKANKGIIRL